MRVDRLAKLPMTTAWLPNADRPGRALIAVAPSRLQRELTAQGAELHRRWRAQVELRGL